MRIFRLGVKYHFSLVYVMLHGQITLDRSAKEKQVSAKPFQGKSGYLLEVERSVTRFLYSFLYIYRLLEKRSRLANFIDFGAFGVTGIGKYGR